MLLALRPFLALSLMGCARRSEGAALVDQTVLCRGHATLLLSGVAATQRQICVGGGTLWWWSTDPSLRKLQAVA